MVRTDVSVKLMALLLQGDPVSDRQLTAAIGFKNSRNIAKHLTSFLNLGYIRELPRDDYGPGNWYQLTSKKEGVLKLYQSKFYTGLRIRIREIPWFIDEIAAGFRPLPPDLFLILREMMQKSHTFFSVITRYPRHERILSAYSAYLFPCRLMRREEPLFQAYYIYAQLYTESVLHDIEHGGLAEGFLEPLDRIQAILLRMAPETKMCVLPIAGTDQKKNT